MFLLKSLKRVNFVYRYLSSSSSYAKVAQLLFKNRPKYDNHHLLTSDTSSSPSVVSYNYLTVVIN